MSQFQQNLGCVEKKNGAANHQMQLWMEHTPAVGDEKEFFTFFVRNVDLSSGGRRCELTRGSRATYDETRAAGQASLAIECAPATV